jgi:hypothetical protein
MEVEDKYTEDKTSSIYKKQRLGIEKEEATNSDKYLGKILNNTGK